MRKFILLACCLFLLCGTTFYFVSLPQNVSVITASEGSLDLTGTDFSETLYSLHGDWEFYFGELYGPPDFANKKPQGGTLIHTPMLWSDAGFPLTGCATYRLMLKTDREGLMLYFPEIVESVTVWINGENVYQGGRPGKSLEDSVTGIRNGFAKIPTENGSAEIIIQVSNYRWMHAGLTRSILIGDSNVLLLHIFMRLAFVGVFIGALLMLGIYHLILFFHRLNDRVYLLFTVICFLFAVRFYMETDSFAVLLSANGQGEMFTYVYMTVMMLICGMLSIFTHIVFRIPYGGAVRRVVFFGTMFAAVLLPFVLPYTILGEKYTILALVPMAMAGFAAARQKALWQNPYNALYLLSLVLFMVWGPMTKIFLNDAYFVPGIVSNLFLLLSQCIILAVSYAESKSEAEKLTAKTEMLDKLNRTKTEFLQDMGHEMKNPLTVIATGIDFANREIKKKNGDIAEASDALDRIRDETQRLGRMVSGMVSLTSISGTGENRKRTDFAALLRGSAEAFRPPLRQRNNDLTIDIAPDMPDVFVESDRFTQVMDNLLSNALAHTKDGLITLTANCDNDFITVCVTDTGEGIPPEILAHVFERGKSGRGSSGYGLYISKIIVEAHGGTIKINNSDLSTRNSQLVTTGTIVTFTVPVYGGQEVGHNIPNRGNIEHE